MSRHLIVGVGEVGTAIARVFLKKDVQLKDVMDGPISLPIDFMHVCIPYNDKFVGIVKAYKEQYKPRHTIIYSSVPIGTTNKLGEDVCHSPVEGVHPHLAASMKKFKRWIGGNSPRTNQAVAKLWGEYIRCEILPDARFTEALKLLSTTEYGVNIEFARYKKKVADSIGMDYELTKSWNSDYNSLYRRLRLTKYRKFQLDAPEGPIGGHCVVSNAQLLNEQYPDKLIKIVRGL